MRLGQTMLRGRFSFGFSVALEEGGASQERDPAQYLCRLFEAMRLRETLLGHSVMEEGASSMTHVDRLFRFWIERRRECSMCKAKSVVSEASWMWNVSVSDFSGIDVTVQELYLRSCAERSVEVVCTRCKSTCAHREQQRMATLPNVLVVRVCRDPEFDAVAVLAEDQLSFPALGPNLDLASVLFSANRSLCAVRCGDGDFWWFDAERAFHPLGPSVCGVLKSRVSMLVYQRQQGDVDFGNRVRDPQEKVSKDVGVGGDVDDAFSRAAATLMRRKQSTPVDVEDTKPSKTSEEQRRAIEAKRQEKRSAHVAVLSERRNRLKLEGAENMSRWLSAGARGTAEIRDSSGAPVRARHHGVALSMDSSIDTYRGQQSVGEGSDVTSTVYGLANVLDDKGLHATPLKPMLKRYRGRSSSSVTAPSSVLAPSSAAVAAAADAAVVSAAATSASESAEIAAGVLLPPAVCAPAPALDSAAAVPCAEPVLRPATRVEQELKACALAAAASHVVEDIDMESIGVGVPASSSKAAASSRSSAPATVPTSSSPSAAVSAGAVSSSGGLAGGGSGRGAGVLVDESGPTDLLTWAALGFEGGRRSSSESGLILSCCATLADFQTGMVAMSLAG